MVEVKEKIKEKIVTLEKKQEISQECINQKRSADIKGQLSAS